MAVSMSLPHREQVDVSTVCHYHTGNRLMAVQYVTTTQGTGLWQYSLSLPHREQADGSTVCYYHTGNRLMAVQYVTTTQGTG